MDPIDPGRFDRLLDELATGEDGHRSAVIDGLVAEAAQLLDSDEGLALLAERATRIEAAGFFRGTAWADPGRLLPPLVRGGLLAPGPTAVFEALSELRMVPLARGAASSDRVTREEARRFLQRALALSLDLVAPEAARSEAAALGPERARAERLCAYLARSVGVEGLLALVTSEIELLLAQRRIVVTRALELLRLADRVPPEAGGDRPAELEAYLGAAAGPTSLSAAFDDPERYRIALRTAGQRRRREEARIFGESLRATGLACPMHAIVLQEMRRDPAGLELALRLDGSGRAELARHHAFVVELIQGCIRPGTAQAIYGLARLLERSALSRPETRAGLRRLLQLELAPSVAARMEARFGASVAPRERLVAGAVSVLGQPLGIGQGRNPTCQSARGLSLWSQLAPGVLLSQLAYVARADRLEHLFEGELLRSDALGDRAVPDRVDPQLDVVSSLLVPPLDRFYRAMLRRVADRDGDGHRWINPALYGPWVGPHMATVFEQPYREFVRRFFASHHPAYSGQFTMIHPTPVGLFVTNAHGELLGRHAVTLQRVAHDPRGELRAYFYNPNDDSRQDWGHGVIVQVDGHGEEEGEGSLPLLELASRLYAFHYALYEEAWGAAVPEDEVVRVERLARESWGRSDEDAGPRFGP